MIDLRDSRQQKEIEQSLQEDSPLTDALDEIIEDSPSLSSLFVPGESLQDPLDGDVDPDGRRDDGGDENDTKNREAEESFEGNWFPTFFDVVDRHKHRTVPKNAKTTTIRFETDAENDYFERASKPGTFVLSMEGEQVTDYSLSMWNGEATLRLEWNEGDLLASRETESELRYLVTVSDPSRRQSPLLDQFTLEIGPEREIPTSNKDSDSKGGGNSLKPQGLSIPEPLFVERENWDEYSHDFTENEAMFVSWLGEDTGYRFYVNGGNRFLERYIEQEVEPGRTEVIKAKFKYSLMLLGLSMLSDLAESQGIEGGLGQNVQTPDDEPNIEMKIKEMSRGAARVILPTLERLDDLENLS